MRGPAFSREHRLRIESLHIDGFGVYHDAHLDLSPGLTVLCGPNESGKSTLLGFLRFMLFGFPGRKRGNRYPPLRAGSVHGGSLILFDGPGRYRLDRHDQIQLSLPDGSAGAEADLDALLGGLTPETFNSVFAFSLHELQQLHDAFDQGTVRDALYGAAAGLDHHLLVSAEEFIEGGSAELFKARSRKSTINISLTAVEQLQVDIRIVENDFSAFDQLGREIGSLEQAVEDAQQQQRRFNSEIKRLEELANRLDFQHKKQSAMEQLVAEQQQLRGLRANIGLDPALVSLGDDIRDLLKGRDHIVALRKHAPEQQRTLETLTHDLSACIAALGAEWTPARIEAFQAPSGIENDIAGQGTELQKAEMQVAEARATERAAVEDHKVALEEEKQAAAAFESMTEPAPQPDQALYDRLLAGRGDYDRATRDIRAREGELRSAEEEFRRSLGEIDRRWTEDDLQRFDTSLPARQQLQRLHERLADTTKALERAHERVAQAEAEANKTDERRQLAQERLDALPRPQCENPATLIEWREIHRRLSLRWAAMSGTPVPRWLPAVVMVVGLATAAALWVPALAIAILIAAASLATTGLLWRLDRARVRTRNNLQADFTALCRNLGFDRSLADESMLEIERALDAAAEAVRQRQTLGEQLQRASQDTSEAGQTLARAKTSVRDAEATMKQENEEWRRHLEVIGLSISLTPDGAIAIVSRIEVCRERLERVRALRHRLEAMERNRKEFLEVLNDLLATRGQSQATHADLSTRLSQFLESVHKEEELRQVRQRARERWMNDSERRRRAEDTLLQKTRGHEQAMEREQQRTAAWRDWLERNRLPSHHSPNSARNFLELLRHGSRLLASICEIDQQRHHELEEEQGFAKRLNGVLTASGRPSSADPVADLDTLGAVLQSAEADAQEAALLDARIGEMDRQLAAVRAELDEAAQQIAHLCRSDSETQPYPVRREFLQQLEELETRLDKEQSRLFELRSVRQAMATDVRLSQLHEQREARIEEIRQAARKWAVFALAGKIFDNARERYEERHQPAVVRRASCYLSRLTGDRYREARMPLDGSDLQILPTGDASLKTIDQLSRGTAEQLYLALRLGFIEEFTRDRSSPPIIMDDILVNFDPGRANASVESLIQFAERFQLLYFTCHPETADRFRMVAPSVRVIELSDGRFVSS